ncbi:LysR family transcriptional regulator [Photobacterium gaetbulicola]|uniref:Putative LysR family transcriptional regulator n=1 Tax=Photobacterium gaetbulicola Gung47 TaxID=658445 RepID=A0A0C5WJI9_9GAMM|nr:LysR family transcriptional regulator [Photobacterium gaetbulicola]AJR06377.1 putative LysR family transcriptional regulator [Photobacterium gaetbulicola Gung47]PSU05475.1 LysR family transcriptional regulator [Photobacterium gaetbulicola]
MISLEQIHSFTLVYQHGSYSAAARFANKERSTIREHVVTLEDTIGVELFNIEGRKAKPTNAAHKLISRATNLSKQAKDFELTAFSLLDDPLGELVLLHDEQIPAGLLARTIKAIKERYPGISIQCAPSSREQAYRGLESNACHIAIMATENSPRTQARIASKYIGNLPLCGYVHARTPLAATESVSLDDLRLETQYELPNTREGDLGFFRVSNVVEKVSSVELAAELLADGGWIALSDALAKPWITSGHLKPLPLANATRNYRQGVCLFFGLASNTREEIVFALDILNHHAGDYLI